jgi:signal transduction histidine kinase
MAETRQTVSLTHESLRLTHERLVHQFHASLLTTAQIRREASSLQAVASWALRASPAGWAAVRNGRLTFTNRSFDAFDRGSVIGPRWRRFLGEPDGAEGDDERGRTLREVALDEAKAMLADPAASRRQGRYARAFTIVEVVVERPIATHDQASALVLVRDITDLVKADGRVASMQARVLEAERAAVAAELAVGVAHDLGNLVGALRARLVGLPHEPAYQLVTTAMETIIDAQAALVNRLQSVAHPRQAEAVTLHLYEDVLKPAVEMVETLLRLGNGGRISVDIDRSRFDDIHIVAPRDEVINMIINLFLNARDAMPNGGAVGVKAARLVGGARLIIEDEGTGIPAADLHRIFEPLFSTKGTNGLGMGLATADALMRRLGGSISARNRPRGGACFELTFVDPRGGIASR